MSWPRTCLVSTLLAAGCGSGASSVVDAVADTSNLTAPESASSTSTTNSVATTEVAHAADVLPGLGRSADAQSRDEFLAAYQVYGRELGLHDCMAEQQIPYALEVDYLISFGPFLDALLDAHGDAADGPSLIVNDLARSEAMGPVEFTDASRTVVARINLDLSNSHRWNEDQAAQLGDDWWLARYGFTLAEIEAAGEAGVEPKGCEATYWTTVPSVWELRDLLRPFVDAYPQASQDQSFQDCRAEFGFAAETLGDLEGSPELLDVFEECMSRWDEAGREARQTADQEEIVAELEVRFADEISEQRQQLVDASTDLNFLALLQSLR